MKQLKIALVLTGLLTLSAQAQININNGVRIVGGSKVANSVAEAPFIVKLNEFCGASIISDTFVLTAAHCVEDLESNPTAGYVTTVDNKVFRVKKVSVHPKFQVIYDNGRPSALTYDFALLELAAKIDFNTTKARPIKLASNVFETQGGQNVGVMATVYGYGVTNENGDEMTDFLMKVSVPVVSHADATVKEAYPVSAATEAVIFAGYKEGLKDACQGDSGGPLVVTDMKSNQKVQIGVVSWGEGCARPFKYGVYSKVSVGLTWMMKVVPNLVK
ncbi:MAG: S1 family serine peptidase [Bacteriovoracaceae bacterium]